MTNQPIQFSSPDIPKDFSLSFFLTNIVKPFDGTNRVVLEVPFRELRAEGYKYNSQLERFFKVKR